MNNSALKNERTDPATATDYIAILRVDHWFKNIFMLPGLALALIVKPTVDFYSLVTPFAIGLLSVCMIVSANYSINEYLDAEFDRHHPLKKARPAANREMSGTLVWLQWLVLAVFGIGLALLLNVQFTVYAITLLFMGVVYNVEPVRTKDKEYLDVLSESINNPLRFLLGWSVIIDSSIPPSSILIAYWMGGAFLMAVKRFAEFRFINDRKLATSYRRSFKFYTENSLLLSALFYALCSSLFLGIFLIKYRIEFLILFPFLAILFVWYLKIGLQADSVVQRPEKLYSEKKFMFFVALLGVLTGLLFVVDIPFLTFLLDQQSFK